MGVFYNRQDASAGCYFFSTERLPQIAPRGQDCSQTGGVRDNCAHVRTADRQSGHATGVAFFPRLDRLRLSRVFLLLLACCPCDFALNPSLDISQYAHKAWTVRDGYFQGLILAIAQTPDGYLWLGTEFGLVRFDGVRSVPWQPPAGQNLPGSYIRSLLAAGDGRLWIGTNEGLASWKDGKLTQYPAIAGGGFVDIIEDRKGTIWASGYVSTTGRLCAIQSGIAQCYGEDGSLGQAANNAYEDNKGNLWVSASPKGLWLREPDPPKFYTMPESAQGLAEDNSGALLIATRGGMKRLVDEKLEAYPLRDVPLPLQPTRLLRDRDGGLWIGTFDRGLLHVHQGRTDVFAQFNGLSGDAVSRIFEDREGNIWVATTNGLDRFRDFAVSTISAKQGLSNDTVLSVLAARDGSIWLGTQSGLNAWKAGQVTIYRKRNSLLPDDFVQSLFQDDRGRIWVPTRGGGAYFETGKFVPLSKVPGWIALSIAGDKAGNVWISQGADQGLFHLRADGSVERIPWTKLGHKDWATSLSPDPVQGGLWLGFWSGGVTYFKDGGVRASFGSADGLGEGLVGDLQLDQEGTLWAATQGGLSRVKSGRIETLTRRNGLPCDAVHWMREDGDHSVWIHTACGLVRIARRELDAWAADSKQTIHATVFDGSEGVRSHLLGTGYTPSVAQSADGKIWFLPLDGVSVIDPRNLPFNKLPPPVHVEEVKVDGKDWDASHGWRLPSLTRDLEIHYTALSLVAPEKNRFRVKLEGRDPDWKDVGNERKAFYNDLPPRNYRFRVMASNNSGVWNETGDSLDFSVDPAYYQTRWFQASCVAAFFVLLWALHRYRLHQIAQKFDTRMEERTRIARELHDTLLQSFQGLLLRFQAVDNVLPGRPDEAKQRLESAIDQAAQAITEGRDAVHDLRSSTLLTIDLAEAMTALGEEISRELAGEDSALFSVKVEGAPRDLHPILRDEIYRIAGEAVRNAFRHAQARRIEAEIRYGVRSLRVHIRDDGNGIDPGIVQEGREGHYGLPGMRERAMRIGGTLHVWSGIGEGTEVDLTIPASIAYTASPAARLLRRFRR
jgi:signal transduction histidine kinase/ligand-binding sensor domain-containing protein